MKVQPFNINIVVVYAPTAQTTEEVNEAFHCTLDNVKIQWKSQGSTIVMGGLDVKVRKGREGEIIGKFGVETCNERGENAFIGS